MADEANFTDILDRAPTEVEVPPPLPLGTYNAVVQGLPVYDKSSKKDTPYVEFTLSLQSPGADVDLEALEKMGGLNGKTMKVTFYLTEDAAYRLDEFHEHCGLELTEDTTRRQRNEMVVGRGVRVYVKHEPSKDGTRTYANISRTLPAED